MITLSVLWLSILTPIGLLPPPLPHSVLDVAYVMRMRSVPNLFILLLTSFSPIPLYLYFVIECLWTHRYVTCSGLLKL